MGLLNELVEFVTETGKREATRKERRKRREWREKTANHEMYFERYNEQPFYFFTDAKETIRQFKREKRHKEAEELLLWCIDFAEVRAELYDGTPPGRYYKDLAIVRRKEKDYEGKVEILERYLGVAGPDANRSLKERHKKAKEYASQR